MTFESKSDQKFQAYKNVMMSSVAAPATAHDSASPQGPEDSCEGPDCLVAAAPPPQAALAAPPATVDSIEPVLPGLQHLKNDQLFFLNFAQVWCGSFRHEALRYWIMMINQDSDNKPGHPSNGFPGRYERSFYTR